jgi:hypothetical protein
MIDAGLYSLTGPGGNPLLGSLGEGDWIYVDMESCRLVSTVLVVTISTKLSHTGNCDDLQRGDRAAA